MVTQIRPHTCGDENKKWTFKLKVYLIQVSDSYGEGPALVGIKATFVTHF
jgi:hypothetical protein